MADELTAESALEGYDFGDASETAGRFKTMGDLVSGYHEARSKLGNSISRPDPQAADYQDQLAKVHDFLGRPKSSGEYKLDRPELPAGATPNEALATDYKGWAHDAGLSNTQANKLYGEFNSWISGAIATQSA